MRFGCVLADAGYGLSAPFRQGPTTRGLAWDVGILRRLRLRRRQSKRWTRCVAAALLYSGAPLSHLKIYPVDVKLIWPIAGRGRPRKRYIPNIPSSAAEDMFADAKWQNVSGETGPKVD
jgi:hypothetical protein